MSHHHLPIPSADQAVSENVEDVAELALAAHYLDLHQQGRTNSGNLFSSVPPDDPAYVTGNLGGIVVLHYIVGPVLFICTVPILVVSLFAVLLLGKWMHDLDLLVAVHHAEVMTWVQGVVLGLLWLYWVVWRLVLCKIIGGLFRNLF